MLNAGSFIKGVNALQTRPQMDKLKLAYPIIRKPTTPATTEANFNALQVGVLSGLVLRFKSDRKPDTRIARVEIYADLTKVRVPEYDLGNASKKRGIRQPIKEFTRTSRRAMLNALAQMRETGQGYFITLTFPGNIHDNPNFVMTKESVKNALASFRKRLARKLPNCGGIWRLEPKRRLSGASEGHIAPHFHLLMFNIDWTDKDETLIQWVSRSWNEIIDPTDTDHLKVGTNVRRIRNRRHAMSYASKYTAKADDPDNDESVGLWGRRWGTFGKVDRKPIIVMQVPTDQLIQVRREMRKFLQSKSFASWHRKFNDTSKVDLVPVKPAQNRYERRLRRLGENKGFSILGLGDLSSGKWDNIIQSTVYRMIAPLSEPHWNKV